MFYKKVEKQILETATMMKIDPEIIKYGWQIEIAFVIDCVISLVLCSALKCSVQAVCFTLLFIFLRVYCGGYHCKSFLSCGMVFTFIVTLSSVLASLICFNSILYQIPLYLILAIICPVENENNTLSIEEKKRYRKIARKRLMIVFVFNTCCLHWKILFLNSIIFMDLLWLTVLCIFQFYFNRHNRRIIE